MNEPPQKERRVPWLLYIASFLLLGGVMMFTERYRLSVLGVFETSDVGFPAVYWRKITVREPMSEEDIAPAVRDRTFSFIALAVNLSILSVGMFALYVGIDMLNRKQFGLRPLILLFCLVAALCGSIRLGFTVGIPRVETLDERIPNDIYNAR